MSKNVRHGISIIVLLLGGSLAWSASTYQSHSQAPIGQVNRVAPLFTGRQITSLPFTISECGTYFVTECLMGIPGANGITIEVDDVTLNLNGNTLTGGGGSLSGIYVTGSLKTNIEIQNGCFRNWGGAGIDLSNAKFTVVNRVSSIDNAGVGILCNNQGSVVRNSIASRNLNGIENAELVNSCLVRENLADGIICGPGAVVRDCTANGNGGRGIVSTDSLISVSTSIGNGGQNFELNSSTSVNSHPAIISETEGPFESMIYDVEGSNDIAVEIIPGRVLVHSISSIETHALFFDGPGVASNNNPIRFVSGDGIAYVASHTDSLESSDQVLDVVVENGLFLSKYENSGNITDYVTIIYKVLP